jgi:hypothetical protein
VITLQGVQGVNFFSYCIKDTRSSSLWIRPPVFVIRSTPGKITMANLSALMLLAVVLTVGIPSFVLGQIVLPGECPKYATQPSFNPAQVITFHVYRI